MHLFTLSHFEVRLWFYARKYNQTPNFMKECRLLNV